MGKQNKPLDLICIGRVAIDLYGQQLGSRLEDMTSFAKYLGGSSGNVAYGTAIQGLKSGMLARVGDEHMGRFLREELQRAGCDTSHLITDKERLTALVILGIKDEDTFPLIFYRENCADMALQPEDIDESYIASARALAITGTHLSHPKTRQAVLTALEYARKHQLRTALDIDYRPVLWGLTSLGDGETRFIASEKVTAQLQEVLHHFDLIVGTEEEFHIAGGTTDTLKALSNVREKTKGTLVCKRGAQGCSVFEDKIPSSWDEVPLYSGVRVEVMNVLGAGDAFMSGLLRGYLNDESWEKACQYANACGGLVVSRHGCAPAMPTKIELDNYISRATQVKRPDKDKVLNHLHRVTTRKPSDWPELCIFAFDHRQQLIDMAKETGADIEKIPYLKKLLLTAAREVSAEAGLKGKSGVLIDTTFGQAALNDLTGDGWWIGRPIEKPSSRPLKLEYGDLGSQLVTWPHEHVVKCLVFYHPQDSETMRNEQEVLVMDVYNACCQSGHELLLEIILPKDSDQNEKFYCQVLEHFYSLGVQPDWWKLPPLSTAAWKEASNIIRKNDVFCRGILLLGLDAPLDELKTGFKHAANESLIKGFAVGRSIFGKPSRSWLAKEIDDAELIKQCKQNYLTLVAAWHEARKK